MSPDPASSEPVSSEPESAAAAMPDCRTCGDMKGWLRAGGSNYSWIPCPDCT
jgi:hypothetical protein